MTQLDYEKDIRIDPDALDIEWLQQASLALQYAKYLEEIRAEVKKMRERKKTKRSELILEANASPEVCCGKAKPNAADIEAYYRTHDDYKTIAEKLISQEEELAYAELAFNEIAWTRKKALENLVTLHGQQYFAGPKVPRNISKEWEAKQKQRDTNTKVARSMRRNTERRYKTK